MPLSHFFNKLFNSKNNSFSENTAEEEQNIALLFPPENKTEISIKTQKQSEAQETSIDIPKAGIIPESEVKIYIYDYIDQNRHDFYSCQTNQQKEEFIRTAIIQKLGEYEEYNKPIVESVEILQLILNFIESYIDENDYSGTLFINEDSIKALAIILKEEHNISLPLNEMEELSNKYLKQRYSDVLLALLMKQNSGLQYSNILSHWITAYVKTIYDKLPYLDLYFYHLDVFLIILDEKNILLTDENTKMPSFVELRDFITKLFYKTMGKDVSESSFFLTERIHKKRDYDKNIRWKNIYLLYYLDEEAEYQYTKKLAEKHKELMTSGNKIHDFFMIEHIDELSGLEFEQILGVLFRQMGYKTEVTKASGDQGADLIVEKDLEKTVIQAKCYSTAVSNTAIQEVVAAKAHYNCSKAIVITNNYFTKSAIELAQSNGVELWDREDLKRNLVIYQIKKSLVF